MRQKLVNISSNGNLTPADDLSATAAVTVFSHYSTAGLFEPIAGRTTKARFLHAHQIPRPPRRRPP